MLTQPILPELRRKALRSALESSDRPLRFMEVHNGISGIVADTARVSDGAGGTRSFDGLWVSGLTESASLGLPDIELLGLQARVQIVRQLMSVAVKPILVDGDTGGTPDQLCHSLHVLEDLGVSGLVIEDKVFPKSNSLDFGKPQVLEKPEIFAQKIRMGKAALRTPDFMLVARIEALVAGHSMEESMERAQAYLEGGADAIVIHSRSKKPDEVLEFASRYRALGLSRKPLICIPTTYNSLREEEIHASGFKLLIYANYLLRSAHKAMVAAAKSILENGRSLETENACTTLVDLFNVVEGRSE